jgi:ABC-type dipeptide/oligopeptide/nickel transport system permease subunit
MASEEFSLPRRSKLEGIRIFTSNPGALVAVVFVIGLVTMAFLAPIIAPYDPVEMGVGSPMQAPSGDHWFGTDKYGRDVLSRVIHGSQASLTLPFVALVIGMVIGTLAGLMSGYLGRWVDGVIVLLVDVMMAFPGIMLTLAVVAVLSGGEILSPLVSVQIAIGISLIPVFVRMVRGSTMSIKETVYVDAANVIGASPMRILLVHILPNTVGPMVVLISSAFTWAILIGASMNFLGLGVQPPTPDWGADLTLARLYLRGAWWMGTFPGLFIVMTILAVNLMGDGLQRVLDPFLRER